MTHVWVIFDGTQPDAAVIGTAETLETLVTGVIDQRVIIVGPVNIALSTTGANLTAVIHAEARDNGEPMSVPSPREWFAERRRVTT